ncbi:hypothetical protein [Nonomuraea sp. KM90]|uniref:hypothetical protein n=1 Tax=Nonomuraea sp. KM90 TaxID=3457428 RepID=UPI003FCD04AB
MNDEHLRQRYPELAELVDGPEFVAIAIAFQAKDRELDRLRAAQASRDETHVWTNTDWKERAEQARAEAHELRAELERRITTDAEALADQTLMRSLTVEDGKLELNLIPPREIVAVWVHAAREMIGDAENYVEMEVKLAGEVERFAFVLQRVGKLTPHEARQAAEGRADQAEAALADLHWLIAAGVHVTIGAEDHNGGADLRVALDLEDEPDDNPAWYGPLGESLADARAYCEAQEIGP